MQPLMAPYGYRCLYTALIATFGWIRLQMAHMAPKHLQMIQMTQYGSTLPIWLFQPSMALCGYRWLYMDLNSYIWLKKDHMTPYKPISSVYSSLWFQMALNGSYGPMAYMAPFGPINYSLLLKRPKITANSSIRLNIGLCSHIWLHLATDGFRWL